MNMSARFFLFFNSRVMSFNPNDYETLPWWIVADAWVAKNRGKCNPEHYRYMYE